MERAAQDLTESERRIFSIKQHTEKVYNNMRVSK